MSAGRPLKLTVTERRDFARGWRDPALTTLDLCVVFRFSPAAAYALARRLNLPKRATVRARAGLPKYGPRPTSWQRGAQAASARFELSVADQLARCAAYLARERDPKAPKWVRCECCGGRAEASVGHPRCTQQEAA
jgi:hypothetical protein